MDDLRKQHIEANVYFILDKLKYTKIEECGGLDYNKCNEYLSQISNNTQYDIVRTLFKHTRYVRIEDVVNKITQTLPQVLQNINKFMVLLDSNTIGIDFYILSKIYDDLRNHPNFEGIFFTQSTEPHSPELLILGDIDVGGHTIYNTSKRVDNYIKNIYLNEPYINNALLHFMIPYITDETLNITHNLVHDTGNRFKFYFDPELITIEELSEFDNYMLEDLLLVGFSGGNPSPVYTDYYVPSIMYSFPDLYSIGILDSINNIAYGSLFVRNPTCQIFADIENLIGRFIRRDQYNDDRISKWRRTR